jgi:hypothetical protein
MFRQAAKDNQPPNSTIITSITAAPSRPHWQRFSANLYPQQNRSAYDGASVELMEALRQAI